MSFILTYDSFCYRVIYSFHSIKSIFIFEAPTAESKMGFGLLPYWKCTLYLYVNIKHTYEDDCALCMPYRVWIMEQQQSMCILSFVQCAINIRTQFIKLPAILNAWMNKGECGKMFPQFQNRISSIVWSHSKLKFDIQPSPIYYFQSIKLQK